MKFSFLTMASVLTILAISYTISASEKDSVQIVEDFSLKNIDGNMIGTTDFPNAKGFIIVFTCNHCPFAKLYPKRMNKLHEKFSALQVPFLAINSMDTLLYEDEGWKDMQEKAIKNSFHFPYLQDGSQAVGKNFNAEHTPAAYIIWKEDIHWVIKYKGAIDNNGEHPETAEPYLYHAVEELLQNKSVTKPQTQSFGCRIFYRK